MRIREIIDIVEADGAPEEEVDEQTPSAPTLLNKVMAGTTTPAKTEPTHTQTASTAGQLNPPTAGIRG